MRLQPHKGFRGSGVEGFRGFGLGLQVFTVKGRGPNRG